MTNYTETNGLSEYVDSDSWEPCDFPELTEWDGGDTYTGTIFMSTAIEHTHAPVHGIVYVDNDSADFWVYNAVDEIFYIGDSYTGQIRPTDDSWGTIILEYGPLTIMDEAALENQYLAISINREFFKEVQEFAKDSAFNVAIV